MKKIKRHDVINATICIIWLFVLNVAATVFVPEVPSWPMFFFTIFLKYHSASLSDIMMLFVSGIVGMLVACMFSGFFGLAITMLGEAPGYLMILFVMLAVIYYGQLLLPRVFNAVCFGFLTLYFINSGSLPMPFGMIALAVMMLVGGGVALVGFWFAGVVSGKLSPINNE